MSRSTKSLNNNSKRRQQASSSSASSSDDDAGFAGSWSSSGSSRSDSEESGSYEETSRASKTRTNAKATAQLSDETQIPLKTAEFHFEFDTKPGDRFDSKGNLKHGGEIELSQSNGRLTAEYVKDKTHFDATNKLVRPREIVKAIRVRNMTVDGWERGIAVAFPTVPAYKQEQYGNKGHVQKRLAQKELNAQTPTSFTVLDRKITNASITFQQDHPDLDPQTFDTHYQVLPKFGATLVPLDSPVIDHYNADPLNRKKQITSRDVSKDWKAEKLVKMETKVVEKYAEAAKKQMSDKISYGDVTNKFAMRISAPMPENRKKDHAMFTKGDKHGIEYQGLADFGYAFPGANPKEVATNGKTRLQNFMDQPQCFAGIIEVDYYVVEGADAKK